MLINHHVKIKKKNKKINNNKLTITNNLNRMHNFFLLNFNKKFKS